MQTRRHLLAIGLAAAFAPVLRPASGNAQAYRSQDGALVFPGTFAPVEVWLGVQVPQNTIIVNTAERFLYFARPDGTARRFPIAVGRAGSDWRGRAVIGRKAKWPAWHPTARMRAEDPSLPERMEGGPNNPLGARALYLYENGRDTLFRIHGTNNPRSIGTASSSGCIRMFNDQAIELFNMTPVGTPVMVL